MEKQAIWVLNIVKVTNEDPAETNTLVFKSEETAKQSFLIIFNAWENDNAQFNEEFTEHSTVNTQSYIYRHYINDNGSESIFSLERFEINI